MYGHIYYALYWYKREGLSSVVVVPKQTHDVPGANAAAGTNNIEQGTLVPFSLPPKSQSLTTESA